MKALSLFSGIGGIDLAGEWAGIKTIAFCERESFCQEVLKKHWPNTPVYDDVTELTKERMESDGIDTGTIGVISAGYPCQPFSHAGKRQGQEDDRHLWPEVYRLLQEIRPRWFVGENVAGHVTLGLDDVLSDLGNIGYTAQSFIIPAAAIGTPQRRDRVFVVGYAEHNGSHGAAFRRGTDTTSYNYAEGKSKAGESKRTSKPRNNETMGNAKCIRFDRESRRRSEFIVKDGHIRVEKVDWGNGAAQSGMGGMLDGISTWLDRHRWPAAQGQEQYEWEPPRVATGVKNRVGRLKSLGNAVVPQQIYPILAAIKQIDDLINAG